MITPRLQQGGFQELQQGKNDNKAHLPIHLTAHAGQLVGDKKKVYEFIMH
jgi:DNA topoisomerase-3